MRILDDVMRLFRYTSQEPSSKVCLLMYSFDCPFLLIEQKLSDICTLFSAMLMEFAVSLPGQSNSK